MDNAISLKSFLKSIAGFSLSSWSGFIIGIISVSLTTRFFAPEVMGGLNQFNNASGLMVGACALGFDNAFIRYYFELPKGVVLKELLLKCVLSSIGVMIVVDILMIFWAGEISLYLFKVKNNALVFLMCLNAFSMMIVDRYFALIYRMSNQIKQFTICQVLLNIVSRLLVIIAAFINPDIETVCVCNTVGIAILSLVYFVVQHKEFAIKKEFINQNGYKTLFRFAITSWPINILVRFNQFIIPFIIGVYLDNFSVGIYVSGLFFCTAFSVLANGFNVYWAPFMYKNYKTKQAFIKNVHEYLMIFSIFVLLFTLISQNLLFLLIGEQYRSSKLFFAMLMLEPVYTMLAGTTSYGTGIKGKNEQVVMVYLFSVTLNVFFSILFISKYGLAGVAFGLGLSAFARMLLVTWRGQKYYQSIHSGRKTLLGLVIIFVIACSNTFIDYHAVIGEALLLGAIVMTIINYKQELSCLCGRLNKSIMG